MAFISPGIAFLATVTEHLSPPWQQFSEWLFTLRFGVYHLFFKSWGWKLNQGSPVKNCETVVKSGLLCCKDLDSILEKCHFISMPVVTKVEPWKHETARVVYRSSRVDMHCLKIFHEVAQMFGGDPWIAIHWSSVFFP